jgi:predicted  nucleic acid-binding Zn-ribbon protein
MSENNNENAINDLKSSISRLKDDMVTVQVELKNFKVAVADDITKLVDAAVKMRREQVQGK